ncbi:Fumarylacetoacetate (FAA) hydrolase family protein [Caulifigura coniformis]|uniref:Fumarylacetoacetate (FAA) hydrolase family protein n=1 Tax=Caulifigura coniformis TaxID=2527983 RepID=A0A517SEL8_9PLAN|nr:fumarylacetoacetate hydrolase family protein [Caulifigura coniformis]QDT54537.1 Fumarylacetoacetate (FAA) hydrolase family protein [Caulifigura coniformis]
MKLAKVKLADGSRRGAMVQGDSVVLLDFNQLENVRTLADVLHSKDPAGLCKFLVETSSEPLPLDQVTFLAPIDRQEVWAAGVTYKRSQIARMEESESGASHYDKVYSAARPELFFKGTASRVSGPGEPVRVRKDSNWSVPEPEFTLVLNPAMQIVGYTIGNDMSARDIEGENPLYLPQAKVYRQCCGLGPVVLLATQPLDLAATTINVKIARGDREVFRGETSLAQLNRKLPELAEWLGKENEFPTGAFLLTGTGIIPPDDFTLENGDSVAIEIAGIGTLVNPVVKD